MKPVLQKTYPQETNYTCALASIRTGIARFHPEIAESWTEEKLAVAFKTSPTAGTSLKQILTGLFKLGYPAQSDEDFDPKGLPALSEKYAVLLLISLDVPHVVVYDQSNDNHIQYYDPFYDQFVSKQLRKFTSEKTCYPFARWKVDVSSLEKYHPDLDISSFKEYEGKQQVIYFKPKFNG